MTPSETVTATGAHRDEMADSDTIYEQRAVFYRPERAFDHGLPDVPVHTLTPG